MEYNKKLFSEINCNELMSIEGGDGFDLGQFWKGIERGVDEITDSIRGFIDGWNS